MPHFIVEYSANLEPEVDIEGLVAAVHRAAIATGIFPLKGTRTRAARRDIYLVADSHRDNTFVHISARIGHGRPLEVRARAGEAIFNAAREFLRPYIESHPLALSFEMQEIDLDTSFKSNNLPQWIESRERT